MECNIWPHDNGRIMKILVVSQYFWPENFRVNELVKELADHGCHVTVLTGLPNYPAGKIFSEFKKDPKKYSYYENIRVYRVPIILRGSTKIRLVLNYISFVMSGSILGSILLRKEKFDEIFVFQTSPITAVVPAILLKRQNLAKLSVWVLDLWPEALIAMKVIKKGLIFKMFEYLVMWIYKNTDRIYISSLGFLPSVIRYAPKQLNPIYFPQWVESVCIDKHNIFLDSDLQYSLSSDKFNVVYAGNFGESQDFESILNAAKLLKCMGVVIYLVGHGRVREWLNKEILILGLGDVVRILGPYPANRMPYIYERASALLVSLRRGPVFTTSLPGKVQTYLSMGKPIVGMLDGEGSRVLKESCAALVVGAGDSRGLAESILKIKSMSHEERAHMGAHGVLYADCNFNKSRLIKFLLANMGEIEASNFK